MNEDYYKKIFSRNLKYYMDKNGKSQIDIINDLGVNKSAISTWCNGTRLPRMDKVDMLAKYFHVKRSDLIEDKNEETSVTSSPRGVTIPVLGRVAAGIPLDAIENIIDTEEITESMASDGEYFGLQIKGDSMEPRIKEGDVVIVRKQSDADDGDLVIALVNGSDAVCKRLRKYSDSIALISNNPAYDPMYFNKDEIESKPVAIIGKVKELRAKF